MSYEVLIHTMKTLEILAFVFYVYLNLSCKPYFKTEK